MVAKDIPQRAFRMTAWIGAAITVIAMASGAPATAAGFAIGAATGLFSLWSLSFAIPRLCHPGSGARLGTGLLLALKVPIYAGIFLFSMSSPHVNALAVFVGAALLPGVLAALSMESLLPTPARAHRTR